MTAHFLDKSLRDDRRRAIGMSSREIYFETPRSKSLTDERVVALTPEGVILVHENDIENSEIDCVDIYFIAVNLLSEHYKKA